MNDVHSCSKATHPGRRRLDAVKQLYFILHVMLGEPAGAVEARDVPSSAAFAPGKLEDDQICAALKADRPRWSAKTISTKALKAIPRFIRSNAAPWRQ